MTDPKKLLDSMRGEPEKMVCGCGKTLIKTKTFMYQEKEHTGLEHKTFEDSDWHDNYFAGLSVEAEDG